MKVQRPFSNPGKGVVVQCTCCLLVFLDFYWYRPFLLAPDDKSPWLLVYGLGLLISSAWALWVRLKSSSGLSQPGGVPQVLYSHIAGPRAMLPLGEWFAQVHDPGILVYTRADIVLLRSSLPTPVSSRFFCSRLDHSDLSSYLLCISCKQALFSL